MNFTEQVRAFSDRIERLMDSIHTEEATKTAIVMPFFAMLGYDVFDPNEFAPEFTADVGIKKGEKVDYAILFDGKPTILVEVKNINKKLNKHASQLFRYFGTSTAKIAILTNGVIYKFYTDLDDANKMDEKPFLEINLLNINENQIPELEKFIKSNFNIDEISTTASDLKYANLFKDILSQELEDPSDEFLKFFLSKTYAGRQHKGVLDRFRGVLKTSLNSYVSELLSDQIKISNLTSTIDILNEYKAKYTEEDTESISDDVREMIDTVIDGISTFEAPNEVLAAIEQMSPVVPLTEIESDVPSETTEHESNVDAQSITSLIRGQKIKASALDIRNKLNIQIDIDESQRDMIDISCLGVDKNNTLVSDEYFVFYNQLETPDESVKMSISPAQTRFNLNLDILPQVIHKIVVVMTIDGDASIGEIQNQSIIFSNGENMQTAEYKFDNSSFSDEKGIILCELYRKDEDFVISVVSNGFNGGLDAILSHFGGQSEM